jgi:hypothetical protein
MAILTVDSLLGCNSIPDFIQSGSKMLFNTSTAPTSWTKDTTSHNNKALRIVTGSTSPGGSVNFSSVFQSSKPVTVATSPSSSVPFNTTSVAGEGSIPSSGATSGAIQSTTLLLAEVATHTHGYQNYGFPAPQTLLGNTQTDSAQLRVDRNKVPRNFTVSPSPLSGSHTHPFTVASHIHDIVGNSHNHSGTVPSHTHPISSPAQSFNILYVDVILATKN